MRITKPIAIPKLHATEIMSLVTHAKTRLECAEVDISLQLNDEISPRATCLLSFHDGKVWQDEWARSTHFVIRSIDSLYQGLETGHTHKLFRSMVYKLFATVVDYDAKYQAMTEVLLNSAEL